MARTPKANQLTANLAADRARALALVPVSRETAARLDRFVELLLQWQNKSNLIAPSTIPTIWTRHIADSLQLLALAPDAKCWVDLGAGAGFPGLVIACAFADEAGARVHLVESNAKKAAFLREAARCVGAPALVHAVRIEDFVKNFEERPDVVSARALAPLEVLLELAHPLLKTGAKGLFPKGQDVDAELTRASKCWSMDVELVPSKTNSRARIVVVHGLRRRSSPK
ncbi:MAG: 16S rRNA (guanine(527)-N(7))-methyltransferase RsmG [Xanthobacteraceae bacterium]